MSTALRLPRQLRDDVKIQAIRAGRSLNTHVVMILSAAIKEEAEEA
ncbi:Arc family DNA-binding protein [Salipiger manganoxidans]|nr:Arc family DNA-binding protein [Salipiger manganoxidans]MCD1619124.1 Arc family DNA-binding protein [Salipiger manganoxidans]